MRTHPIGSTHAVWMERDPSGRDRVRGAAGAPYVLVRFWWVTLVRGLFGLMLGAAVLWSGNRSSSLVTFMGLYWLAGGALTLRWALGVRWATGTRLGLVAGLSAVAVGALVLLRDLVSALLSVDAVATLLGITAILTGALRVAGAFEIERRTGHRWTLGGVILGAFELGLGTLLLLRDTLSARGLFLAAGMWALVGGTLLLLDGIRLMRLNRLRSAPTR
jgi:uncharacterized membrane protein HdeD (DUF308 family)